MDARARTTVLKAGPADLIAAVWFNLGFKPAESLILAGVAGPKNRIGVILRIDLPDRTASRSWLGEVIRSLFSSILATTAEAVVAIVASEEALTAPVHPIVPAIEEEIEQVHLGLFEVLGLSSTAYRSLLCADPRCCPPAGLPIETVMASKSAATHVLQGDTVAETVDDLLSDVRPEPGLDPEPGPIPHRGRSDPADLAGRPRLVPGERWEWWQSWIGALAVAEEKNSTPNPPVPGLSGAMHDPYLRDAVLMHLLGAHRDELTLMLDGKFGTGPGSCDDDGDDAGPPPPDLGELLKRPPDEQRLFRGEAVLAGAARVAAVGDRAPALAVLALLAWYMVRGGRSRLLAEQARADDPALTLTALVEDLLFRRIPPPWVRRRRDGPDSGAGNEQIRPEG